VQQWRRDELAESVAPVWFHRADMEMLLAYVVFSSSAERCVFFSLLYFQRQDKSSAALVFVHEESQWKYHNAVIVDSSKIAEWSDSIDTAEQRFSAGQMFQRSSSFVRSGSINSVGSDAQDYWQLYDMELPRDPSEGVLIYCLFVYLFILFSGRGGTKQGCKAKTNHCTCTGHCPRGR